MTPPPEVRVPPSRLACIDCTIRRHAVCAHCNGPELDALADMKSFRVVEPARQIASEGERTAFLGSLLEGVASVSRLLPDGRRQVVGLLFPGDFVGRPFASESPYDVTAVTRVRMCLFQRDKFEALVRSTPSLERRLLEMTLDELDAAREWMVLLGRKTAQEKLASFFVMAAGRAMRLEDRRPIDGMLLELPLTREDMADYLGLTIETVSRQIGALRRAGLVELVDARNLLIPDWEALVESAGGEFATV